MSEQRQRGSLFSALRQIMKVRGLRYRDLARLMNTSEPTIKRLFKEQDCKLSRLVELCELLGVPFADLVELAANTPVEPTTLSLQTESALAAAPGLTAFFMLLISGFDLQTIAEQNTLSATDVYLYLRELEKLDLVKVGGQNSFQFTVKRPVRWRFDGPLHQILVGVNQRFVKDAMMGHEAGLYPFYTSSRLFSDHSIKQLKNEVDNLHQRFQRQASLDQLFYPPAELQPYKMVCTLSPFDLQKYFEVPAFRTERDANSKRAQDLELPA